jgi:hypothetical protein
MRVKVRRWRLSDNAVERLLVSLRGGQNAPQVVQDNQQGGLDGAPMPAVPQNRRHQWLGRQIHPQRKVLIENPAQRGVHRMRGCEVAAEPAVHRDYRALTQFGGLDLIDERIE